MSAAREWGDYTARTGEGVALNVEVTRDLNTLFGTNPYHSVEEAWQSLATDTNTRSSGDDGPAG